MILLIYAIVSIASDIILLALMNNAPEGWEDENGFHLREKLDTDEEKLMVNTIKIR